MPGLGGDPAALKPIPIFMGSLVLSSSFTLSLPQGPGFAHLLTLAGAL